MSAQKIPPDLQRKIAAMAKAPPPPRAPAPGGMPMPAAGGAAALKAPVAARAPAAPGGAMRKFLMAGWAVALIAIAVAAAESYVFGAHERASLASQAEGYEKQIADLKAQAASELKKVQDDASAAQQVLQTQLDFEKMPELPLKTVFRAGQVLYVENESDETFACKVRLFRPIGAVTKEVDFSIKPRAFNDMGAIENWMFAKGDQVEFIKPGFKPRSLVVP